MTNRLAQESSPYLLQHAHNPVDWYPWGEEAFEAARSQNKPIFLSVGYSTCYWCHVMERQSFENDAIAAEMNSRFINIKVDREERPDVDQLYMTAVQLLTRQGGWPMSVFLRPDLRPFYGGTYFPPTDMHGRPGFVTILRAIDDAFHNRGADVEQSATQLLNLLQQLAQPTPPDADVRIDDQFIDRLIERSDADFDPQHGGFGHAPKFPRETLLELLLVHQRQHPSAERMQMLRKTLDALAMGGIRDHLGGGFHRYSTDEKWLVPHFEIMLYDNAMLAWVYAEAHRQTQDANYADVLRGICDFVLREMTSREGAFYTAFDAEVDAREGASYLWTPQEIVSLLGPENAKLFNQVYGLDLGPNFADPHHGTGKPDANILYLPRSIVDVAKSHGYTVEQLQSRLNPMRHVLYEARLKRKQPLLDTKIITGWNALMIRALAYAGEVLGEQRYSNAAAQAADFLLNHHRTPEGALYRTSRDGQAKHHGFLDDYAFLVQALLQLNRREDAASLAQIMQQKFGGPTGGFFFTDSSATDLIVRQMTAQDSPLPSGNAIAVLALLDLDQPEPARKTLEVFAQQIQANAEGMSSMIQAAIAYISRQGAIDVIATKSAHADRPLTPEQIAQGVVSLDAELVSDTELHLTLSILGGFHINSHDAAPGLIATNVTVRGLDVARIDYPPGELREFAFADEPIRVYDNHAIIVVRLNRPPEKNFSVSISYQPCDENACLPPITKTLQIAVA